MAVGTGIECINLKKAKYNRNVRNEKMKAVTSEPLTENTYNKEACAAVPVSRISSGEESKSRGITVKDVIDAIGDEVSKAIAARRRKKAKERANETKYITKDVKSTKTFPISIVGYIVIFSVIAMFLVLGNSRINEATLSVESLKNSIAAEKNKCEILTSELNARYDVREIEEYAINEMGLVKMTDVRKTYIDISGEDTVVVQSGSSDGSSVQTDVTMTLDSGN